MIASALGAFVSVRRFLPVFAIFGVLAALYLGFRRYENIVLELAETRQTIKILTEEAQKSRAETNTLIDVIETRETETKLFNEKSGKLKEMIDDARTTDHDSALPPLAIDYLERLRSK